MKMGLIVIFLTAVLLLAALILWLLIVPCVAFVPIYEITKLNSKTLEPIKQYKTSDGVIITYCEIAIGYQELLRKTILQDGIIYKVEVPQSPLLTRLYRRIKHREAKSGTVFMTGSAGDPLNRG